MQYFIEFVNDSEASKLNTNSICSCFQRLSFKKGRCNSLSQTSWIANGFQVSFIIHFYEVYFFVVVHFTECLCTLLTINFPSISEGLKLKIRRICLLHMIS